MAGFEIAEADIASKARYIYTYTLYKVYSHSETKLAKLAHSGGSSGSRSSSRSIRRKKRIWYGRGRKGGEEEEDKSEGER